MFLTLIPKGEKSHEAIFSGKYFAMDDISILFTAQLAAGWNIIEEIFPENGDVFPFGISVTKHNFQNFG